MKEACKKVTIGVGMDYGRSLMVKVGFQEVVLMMFYG